MWRSRCCHLIPNEYEVEKPGVEIQRCKYAGMCNFKNSENVFYR